MKLGLFILTLGVAVSVVTGRREMALGRAADRLGISGATDMPNMLLFVLGAILVLVGLYKVLSAIALLPDKGGRSSQK